MDLSRFTPGCIYDTDPLVAALLIAEGWAFPLPPPPPAPPAPPAPPKLTSILPPTPIYRK